MQPSLSPPWTDSVYLKDYTYGSYADNTEPYALEVFLLPCGLCDTLALIPLGLEIFYIFRLVISYPCAAYHKPVSVHAVWRACPF